MDFYIGIFNFALIIAVAGLATNVLVGSTGLMSVGQAAVMGIGGYLTAVASLNMGVPFPFTVVISAVGSGLVYTAFAWPALRVSGETLILLTLAFQSVVSGIFLAWTDVTGGTNGLAGVAGFEFFGSEVYRSIDVLPYVGGLFLICWLVCTLIDRAPFGTALRAVREDGSAASALGVDVVAVKIRSFAVAGVITGVAGSALAHYQAFVDPSSFTFDQSVLLLAIVVLGGAGSPLGSVVAGLILGGLPSVLLLLDLDNETAGLVQRLIYGLVLIAFMIFRPQGLVPEGWRPWSRPLGARAASDAVALGDLPPAEGVSLRATGLMCSFGGVRAAHDLSIDLEPGKVTALVGPNGAGKTTVFNLLTGFVSLEAGTVHLERGESGPKVDVTSMSPWQRSRCGIVRTFQDVRVFGGLSVLDNVAAAVPGDTGRGVLAAVFRPFSTHREHLRLRGRALDILTMVGIEESAQLRAGTLAFGEQKMLSVARAAATDAPVLLLDEPAAGVDGRSLERMLELVRSLAATGRTICLVEHNLEAVRAVSDHAYFMTQGRVIGAGSTEELMADANLADIYFGTPLTRS